MQLSCINLFLYLQHKEKQNETICLYNKYLFSVSCLASMQLQYTDYGFFSTSHSESDSAQEICTPFCACSSFHNPNFIAKNSFGLRNIDSTPVKKIAIYNENQTSSHLDSLWRPPKA